MQIAFQILRNPSGQARKLRKSHFQCHKRILHQILQKKIVGSQRLWGLIEVWFCFMLWSDSRDKPWLLVGSMRHSNVLQALCLLALCALPDSASGEDGMFRIEYFWLFWFIDVMYTHSIDSLERSHCIGFTDFYDCVLRGKCDFNNICLCFCLRSQYARHSPLHVSGLRHSEIQCFKSVAN